MNKNLKYTLIEIMTKYIYLIKDKNEQIKLINIISNDYINNYYSSSYYIRNFYQYAVCNFGSMSNDLFIHLHNRLLTKKIFAFIINTWLQGKGNRRKIFDSYLEIINRNYRQNEDNRNIYGSIYVYFSSSTCSKNYFLLKSLWFTEEKNMSFDVLRNYFGDKLICESEGDLEELLNIANDFTSA